jgi:hypothetical protein
LRALRARAIVSHDENHKGILKLTGFSQIAGPDGESRSSDFKDILKLTGFSQIAGAARPRLTMPFAATSENRVVA